MSDARVVLVTGVARHLGSRLASRLAGDPGVAKVIGVDSTSVDSGLAATLRGVAVHRIDLRSSQLLELMLGENVDAVVHLAVSASPSPAAGGRPAMKELNIIGTMQLLAACQRAPAVNKLVMRSSTAAYGASFRDPAVFTEDLEPREVPRGGFARDVFDIEGYVRGFRRRRPDVAVTVLRLAPLLAPDRVSWLSRYLARPLVPTVFGRDPRLQFLHVDDALETVRRALVEEHPGTFNVAGEGVLTLSQTIRRARGTAVPVIEQGISTAVTLGRGSRAVPFTFDQLDLLVHGRVVDTSRLVDDFGFRPRSTAQTLAEYVRGSALAAGEGRCDRA